MWQKILIWILSKLYGKPLRLTGTKVPESAGALAVAFIDSDIKREERKLARKMDEETFASMERQQDFLIDRGLGKLLHTADYGMDTMTDEQLAKIYAEVSGFLNNHVIPEMEKRRQ